MENFKPIKDINSFDKLMPFKIKKILLVASIYDSFMLSEEENFNSAIFGQMSDSYNKESISIQRAKTVKEALEKIKIESFDLIMSMVQVGESDMDFFVSEIKKFEKSVPIVFLSFNLQDILNVSDFSKENIDGLFLWQGDSRIFSAIVNLIEDSKNFEHDSQYGVQAVLLVEDNIRFYSIYLPLIYSELMKQTQIVMAEELNPFKKNLRLKARPKILLKTNYEGAWEIYSKYKYNLLGIISDIEYPKDNKTQSEAGFILCEKIKKENIDMPILLQSSNSLFYSKALSLGASFLNKNSQDLSKQIRNFIRRYFGFGDFVFDDGNGNEIARASDLNSMLKILKQISDSSIIYHASRNHFSKWLFARTEFQTAYHIMPKKISEFKDANEIREYLMETIHQFVYKNQLGSVLKFDSRLYDSFTPFSKIGNGTIGGKARGLAFIDFLISKNIIPEELYNIKITTPNSIVLSTDVFDFFIENNEVESLINENYSDEKIANIFSNIKLPDYALKDLSSIIEKLDFPLAVRSSSMLEDSKTNPFAGIYKTYMLRNNESSFLDRFNNLQKAIKYIYASVFSAQAKSFRKVSVNTLEEEKMAIVIQKVVGRKYTENYYYPFLSGVLHSYNFYPVHPIRSEDPVAHICMGLGETVVSGNNFLRYSPVHPRNIHQFANVEDTLINSQKKILAIDFSDKNSTLNYEKEKYIKEIEVEELEKTSGFEFLSSYYFKDDEMIYDSYKEGGYPVLNFSNIIKNEIVPLNKILTDLSKICSDALGSNIEMEFALDYDAENKKFIFNILQIRPMLAKTFSKKVSFENLKNKEKILLSNRALGNGLINNIQDIVYVKRENFSRLKMNDMILEIDKINEILKNEKRNYILIGPGRWGSSDMHLGIGVKWNNISMVKIIIETGYKDLKVDPSYGTHFFHNVTSLGIGYFSMLSNEDYLNFDWLEKQNKIFETEHIVLIRTKENLDIRIDGTNSKAIIYN